MAPKGGAAGGGGKGGGHSSGGKSGGRVNICSKARAYADDADKVVLAFDVIAIIFTLVICCVWFGKCAVRQQTHNVLSWATYGLTTIIILSSWILGLVFYAKAECGSIGFPTEYQKAMLGAITTHDIGVFAILCIVIFPVAKAVQAANGGRPKMILILSQIGSVVVGILLIVQLSLVIYQTTNVDNVARRKAPNLARAVNQIQAVYWIFYMLLSIFATVHLLSGVFRVKKHSKGSGSLKIWTSILGATLVLLSLFKTANYIYYILKPTIPINAHLAFRSLDMTFVIMALIAILAVGSSEAVGEDAKNAAYDPLSNPAAGMLLQGGPTTAEGKTEKK